MVEVVALEKRDREEEIELDGFIQEVNAGTSTIESSTPAVHETFGRQTGTSEWKAARGEDGTPH